MASSKIAADAPPCEWPGGPCWASSRVNSEVITPSSSTHQVSPMLCGFSEPQTKQYPCSGSLRFMVVL